ncbi:UNVERIFIED_CONTAM: threonine/homoserine/homoserine lactone efflux protein [Brevibacillus sp. OAP136]
MGLLLQYLIFGVTLAISIGPVNIELIKRGVTKGFLSSWLVGIGGMTADFLILSIVYVGVGTYLAADLAQLVFGVIGALMLIMIGIQNARTKPPRIDTVSAVSGASQRKEKRSFVAGFLLAIANPLNLVFWAGIYSSLPSGGQSHAMTPSVLLVFIFIGIALANLFVAGLSSLGKSFVKPAGLRLISVASGIVLIGYGCWIGYSTVSAKFAGVVHAFLPGA